VLLIRFNFDSPVFFNTLVTVTEITTNSFSMNLKNYSRSLFLLFALFLAFYEADAQVMINEFSCSNVSTVTDNFGDTPDWVEIYNAGSSSVNLDGYYLSDKISNPTKWEIPAGVSIPAGGFKIIWCSGRNTVSGVNVHAGIKLTQTKPEALVFANPAGTIIDSMTLRPTLSNNSRGRTTNGASTWSIFTTPTPNAANSGAKQEYASMPVMDIAPGFYSSAQTVTISSPDAGVTIRYTTNGSTPTTSSTLYSAPVSIAATTVLRARAFSSDPNIPASFVNSNTYFINANHTVPVVSVFGNQTMVLLTGTQIETETGMEYFDETKTLVAETDGEANEHGNDSWSYNQRGFDYVSKDEFGYNYGLNYKVFSNKQRASFERIIFKAAANDNYPFESGGAHIRDSYAHTLAQRADLNLDARTWKASIVYVNGQYWGVYDTREKVDDTDFTDYYYQQDEPNVQFLQTWGGTWSAYGGAQAQTDWNAIRNYITTNDMSIQPNYDYVDTVFNVKSFVDYFVFNSWLVTMDWLNWNTAWWRGLDPDGDKKKWRYTLWDLDAIMGHYVNYTGIPDPSASADPCNVEGLPNPGGQGHTEILNSLMANPGFKQYYQARYIDLMNTKLSCNVALPLYDSMIAVIQPEMAGQIAKWGGSYSTWQNNAAKFRDSIEARCTSLTQGLMDCYSLTGPYPIIYDVSPAGAGEIKINSITPGSYAFTGNYFGGIVTKLKAKANATYTFDHWRINNHTPAPSVTSDSADVSFTQADSVIAVFKKVDSVVVDPPPPGTDPPPPGTGPPPPGGGQPPVNGEDVGIPTAFSPNGDGINDILYVLGDITNMEFNIYNRWGQEVFHTKDPSVGWDGKFRGTDLNPGVFAYRLSGKLPNGNIVERKGNITLVR
jgi:gliding motility-associated-like protein